MRSARLNRVLRSLLLVALGLALGAVGWWAVSTVMLTAAPVDEPPPPPTVTVAEGTVGRTLTLVSEATRERTPLPATMATGRITALPMEPRVLNPGDVAFEVDLRPVVIAQGAVPAFRDMASGATGADVRQLQELLIALGYDLPADGRFGWQTTAAVRAWQADSGLRRTGVVLAGDLLFAPQLPVSVMPALERRVGDLVQPGTVALDAVSSEPQFIVQISTDQVHLVSLDASMVVDPEGAAWPAHVVDRIVGTGPRQGSFDLVLAGPAGPVCAAPCPQVSAADDEVFSVEVTVVPETTGPAVPISAVRTAEDGRSSVVLDSGAQVPVTVLAAAHGRAVVEGVDVGAVVQVFAEPTDDQ